VDQLFDAFEAFRDRLVAIHWLPLAVAVLVHVVRLAVRSRAWRNVIAAAYPDQRVPWPSVFAAYVAGVGVNAVLPARGGDLLKLFLVRRQVPGSSYSTLAATLAVETIFDFVIGGLLITWALASGSLPGVDALGRLPTVDWFWVFRRPWLAAVVAAIALVAGFLLGVWSGGAGRALKARLAQGVVILRTPRVYLRKVAAWQALDWTLRFVAIALFLSAFGVPVTLQNTFAVQAAQSVSTLLPLTPSGIGTEQALLVYVLSGEAATSGILSFSVGMRVTLASVNVALGALTVLIVLRTLRWRQIVEDDHASARQNA
jgi:uncharacterized membrane protein YbhN (UPF0104 family)